MSAADPSANAMGQSSEEAENAAHEVGKGATRASRKDAAAADRVDDTIQAELIPEELQEAIDRRVEMKLERYNSPHPHPDHLERYAALYPDAPKIVFETFRDQGNHRRAMERTYMEGSERRANIGQWLAFLLVGGTIAGGFVAILQGEATAGALIMGGALGGGIILAISGARHPKPQAVKKTKAPGPGNSGARGEITRQESKDERRR